MKSERNDLLAKRYYKELPPTETINKIKNKLNSLGFEIEEHELDSGVGTFSYGLFLLLNGYMVSFSNGKGNTKEYSRASAYAEMLERLQTNPDQILKNFYQFVDKFPYKGKMDYAIYPDDKNINSLEEYIENNSIVTRMKDYPDFDENYNIFDKFVKSQYEFYGYIPLQKYTNSDENETRYINESYFRYVNGSTGLCAGNSKYEALTQGISEILERRIKWEAFRDKLTYPVIPEENLKPYEYAYSRIKSINESGRYTLEVRDLSHEGKFPVVAVVIYDRVKRGRLVNVGSFPIFEIALNRALNELFQGQNINNLESMKTYINYNLIPLKEYYGDKDLHEWTRSLKDNSGLFPEEFFSSDYDFELSDWATKHNSSNYTNEELFKRLCKIIENDFDTKVWYKEYSFLGFRSYSVICPGMFEETYYSRGKEFYRLLEATSSFTIDKELNKILYGSSFVNIHQLKKHMDEKYKDDKKSKLLLNYVLGIPTINENASLGLLKGCISILDGDYKKASKYFFNHLPKYYKDQVDSMDYMHILINYLSLKSEKKFDTDEKIKYSLYKIYKKDYVDDVIHLCSNPDKLISIMFVKNNHPLSLMNWGLYFAQADAFYRIYNEKENGNIKI